MNKLASVFILSAALQSVLPSCSRSDKEILDLCESCRGKAYHAYFVAHESAGWCNEDVGLTEKTATRLGTAAFKHCVEENDLPEVACDNPMKFQ